jgi:hypothetical protein
MGSRVYSNRTTPVAWVFMGRSLEDNQTRREPDRVALITREEEEGI